MSSIFFLTKIPNLIFFFSYLFLVIRECEPSDLIEDIVKIVRSFSCKFIYFQLDRFPIWVWVVVFSLIFFSFVFLVIREREGGD